ncbi:MAG: Abi family protein [Methylophaga sp.]|nr:Abi family protein [Methylophaga sp.]
MINIDHSKLEPYISTARLSTYNSFFSPASKIELFGCYLWGKEVAAAFFPLLQVLEVTLRNSIHNEASQAIGSYWFDNVTTKPVRHLSSAQTRHISYLKKSIKDARNNIRRDLRLAASATVSEDRIIAKLPFGFWTNLFSAAFDVNRASNALWPVLLRPIFPNAPRGARDRAIIQSKLLTIKNFRNKAFHHEPVWNIGRPAGIPEAIRKLLDTKGIILEIIKWISLDSLELVEKAGYVDTINRICSAQYLEHLKHPGKDDKPFSLAKRELRKILRQKNYTTNITLNGVRIGRIIGK